MFQYGRAASNFFSGGQPNQPLGGIRLDAPLSGAELRGVTIDPASGNIILLADRNFLARGLDLHAFAEALYLEFGPDGPQAPQFSLDPDNPNNPRGPWLRAVYVPEKVLQGRTMGAQLASGDLVLKELAFETMLSPQGKLVPWRSAVPGFTSYAQMALDDPEALAGREEFARWWIVSDQVTARRSGTTLLFDARMAVKAKRQVPDPSSPTGLRDIETPPDALEAIWARQLTDHYNQLASESVALTRVRNLAIAVAIAKSLRAMGARVDLARIVPILNSDDTRTIHKINAFSMRFEREQRTPFRDGHGEGVRISTRILHLFGGIDLSSVHPVDLSDDGSARAVAQSEKKAFQSATPVTKVVHFEYDHAPLVAIKLPLLLRN